MKFVYTLPRRRLARPSTRQGIVAADDEKFVLEGRLVHADQTDRTRQVVAARRRESRTSRSVAGGDHGGEFDLV